MNRGWLIALGMAAILGNAIADDDHVRAKRLHKSGDIVSIEQILNRVRQSHQGRVIEVDLEEKHGRYLYEIELVDNQGEVRKFYFDAGTGEPVNKSDDD